MTDEVSLLKAIFHMSARAVITNEELLSIVAPRKGQEKYIDAYNLCDGTRKQGEVAKEIGLDAGNFSKAVTRWVSKGIAVRLGDGNDIRLLHAYPIMES